MRYYSIGLLVVGIGLIAGSCVPLAQTVWRADPAPRQSLVLTPDGVPAELVIGAPVQAVPVLRIETRPGLAGLVQAAVPHALSMRGPSGRVLLDATDTAVVFGPVSENRNGRPVAMLRLRFNERRIPAGHWRVRLDAGDAATVIRRAELRLLPPAPGIMPAIMTALMLGIVGWLAATLGALQWIRVAAATPVTYRQDAGPEGARGWAIACHLSALIGYLLPFGHLLGPFAVWRYKRRVSADVDAAGRSALNFQLSITIYVLVALLLTFFLIGVALLFLLAAFQFAMVLFAALRTQRGLPVRYPLSMRFIEEAEGSGTPDRRD